MLEYLHLENVGPAPEMTMDLAPRMQLLGERPTSQVVMLIDEVESHLHPRWQRTILRSLLSLMKDLHEEATMQLVTATHSPLIPASAEPFFDASQDAWFDLDLVAGEGGERVVQLTRRDFVRRGDVSSWLTSEAFDLRRQGKLREGDT